MRAVPLGHVGSCLENGPVLSYFDIMLTSLPQEQTQTQNLLELDRSQLQALFQSRGEPKYRADQIWQWIWNKGATDFQEMTNISKALRARLQEEFVLHRPRMLTSRTSQDGTIKFLLGLPRDGRIESVLIPEKDYYTQCLSTQVGCPMGCVFCSTGDMGLERNLTPGEIASQILIARDYLTAQGEDPGRLTNIVLMGMGEPLLNWEAVHQALIMMIDELGLGFSRRRVTLSTVGLPGKLQEFGRSRLGMLAVSLHAPDQELRKRLMPRAANWDLQELIRVLEEYPLAPRERITIEYVLFQGINDSPSQARDLVRLLSRVKCKVNLLAYNPGESKGFLPPDQETILKFEEVLHSKGMTVTLRKSKGQDISAACGQLKGEDVSSQ